MIYADRVIREAIDFNWSRLNDPDIRRWKEIMPPAVFLHEFATVTLNLGRGSGCTTYIKDNAISKDLIVVRTMNDKKYEYENANKVISIQSILRSQSHRGLYRIEKIWVDAASQVFTKQSDMYQFYQEISGLNPNQIIMLG